MDICLLLTCLFVTALSVSDLWTRTIPGWVCPAFAAASGILHLILKDLSLPGYLAGLLPGAVLLVLSLIFRASLGTGDGLVVMACGAALGPGRVIAAMTAALVLCAAVCVFLLIRKRVRRSDSLPFLPFLAVSHIIMLTAEVIF